MGNTAPSCRESSGTCPESMVKESELFHVTKWRFGEACSSFPLRAKLCSGERPFLFSLDIRLESTRDAGRELAGLLRVWLCPHARCILVQTVTKRQGGLQMQFPSRGFKAHQPSLLRKRSKAEMKAILSFEEHRGLGCRGAGNAPEVTEQMSRMLGNHIETGEWLGRCLLKLDLYLMILCHLLALSSWCCRLKDGPTRMSLSQAF